MQTPPCRATYVPQELSANERLNTSNLVQNELFRAAIGTIIYGG
jgi:hypothetical protein